MLLYVARIVRVSPPELATEFAFWEISNPAGKLVLALWAVAIADCIG
jgi:hypothetical protein